MIISSERPGSGPGAVEIERLAALFSASRLGEAEAVAQQMIQAWPDHGFGWKVLGTVLAAQGRLPEAVPALERSLALLPSDPETHSNLGKVLQDLGRSAEAETRCRQALGLRPEFHGAHHNLGNALMSLGRTPEAEESLLRALALAPDYSEAYSDLGCLLQSVGRLPEAESSFRRALELKQDFPEAHNNCGIVLQALGRLHEAEANFRRAVELKPDYHDALYNLGNTHLALGRSPDAETSYRRVLELKPDYQAAHHNLGNALKDLGRLEEAVASYRRALELKPDLHDAHTNVIFALDLMEGRGISEQQEERKRWYARHGKRCAESIRPHRNTPDPERKLRVGYVSADFRRQSACYIFGPVIRHHDPSMFEVFCYSGVKQEDEITALLRQAAHAWRSTLSIPDEDLAGQIRDDGIDILVDLSGHMAGNRLLVFARKPAPVQVTAWGYANGTGLETIDYFLADPVVVPLVERSLFAEEIFDLPCFVCYEPPEYLPEVSPQPALCGRPFTFACINRVEKISDRILALWGRILAALPEAGLLVKGWGLDDPKHREHFLRRSREAGIGEDRVRLLGNSPHHEHLKTYQDADLVLDPFPHGGGVSTAESLCMGVPVVTLQGATPTSRPSASILTVLNARDWIAQTDADYVRIAVDAARDLPRLARTREQLRSRLAESIVGDVRTYTRAVETAYRSMWRRWCHRRAA